LAAAVTQSREAVDELSGPQESLALVRFAFILATRERFGGHLNKAEVTEYLRGLREESCGPGQKIMELEMEAAIRASYGDLQAIRNLEPEVVLKAVSDLTYFLGRDTFTSVERISDWIARAEEYYGDDGPAMAALIDAQLTKWP
jgi:hypothetical protein